ncbi:hypothetical protein ACFV4G_29935 [Kitasatospora sp. NPDC059747]|uniref:hypothetical protein n=1 Tax=Kitasatospora sp. NPDC059747 TaxID=3346930 RepID=UPI00365EB6DC
MAPTLTAAAWQGVLAPLGHRATTPERPMIAPVPISRPLTRSTMPLPLALPDGRVIGTVEELWLASRALMGRGIVLDSGCARGLADGGLPVDVAFDHCREVLRYGRRPFCWAREWLGMRPAGRDIADWSVHSVTVVDRPLFTTARIYPKPVARET